MAKLLEFNGVTVGQVFRHYKGDTYTVTGISTFSGDPRYDGAVCVTYENADGKDFTTFHTRFLENVVSVDTVDGRATESMKPRFAPVPAPTQEPMPDANSQ